MLGALQPQHFRHRLDALAEAALRSPLVRLLGRLGFLYCLWGHLPLFQLAVFSAEGELKLGFLHYGVAGPVQVSWAQLTLGLQVFGVSKGFQCDHRMSSIWQSLEAVK